MLINTKRSTNKGKDWTWGINQGTDEGDMSEEDQENVKQQAGNRI